MRTIALLICIAATAAFAQTAAAPAFEAASIRVGQPGRESIDVGPASVTLKNIHLSGLLRWAYIVEEYQVSGPSWMNEGWFDVFAKSAAPATERELRQMMQTLLAERFKVAVHRETKEMPALLLSVGKNGHKLQPNEKEGSPSFKTGKLSLTGDGATIKQLTEFLAHEIHEPVIDHTNLTGRFNYFLDISVYVTDEMRKSDGPPPEANGIIAAAMQSQLGLKLEEKKTPVELVVVDRAEKLPTEN